MYILPPAILPELRVKKKLRVLSVETSFSFMLQKLRCSQRLVNVESSAACTSFEMLQCRRNSEMDGREASLQASRSESRTVTSTNNALQTV